jgi:hypothetical protein
MGHELRKVAKEMGLPLSIVKLYGKPPYDSKGLTAKHKAYGIRNAVRQTTGWRTIFKLSQMFCVT